MFRNIAQTFPSIPGLYYVNEDHIRFVLHWYCVNAIVSTSLLSPYCILVRSRPHNNFFEHVQNSSTSAKTIKIASHPYPFLLRSFYVVQVCTAANRFYIEVVGTWFGVTGILESAQSVKKYGVGKVLRNMVFLDSQNPVTTLKISQNL